VCGIYSFCRDKFGATPKNRLDEKEENYEEILQLLHKYQFVLEEHTIKVGILSTVYKFVQYLSSYLMCIASCWFQNCQFKKCVMCVSRIDSIVPRIDSIVLRIDSIVPRIDTIVLRIDLIVIRIDSIYTTFDSTVRKIDSVKKNQLDFDKN